MLPLQAGWLTRRCAAGLNCVGGAAAAEVARALAPGGTLVTYGGMSKGACSACSHAMRALVRAACDARFGCAEPVALPTSLFIFRNLTARGFWLTEWTRRASEEQKARPVCHAAAASLAACVARAHRGRASRRSARPSPDAGDGSRPPRRRRRQRCRRSWARRKAERWRRRPPWRRRCATHRPRWPRRPRGSTAGASCCCGAADVRRVAIQLPPAPNRPTAASPAVCRCALRVAPQPRAQRCAAGVGACVAGAAAAGQQSRGWRTATRDKGRFAR